MKFVRAIPDSEVASLQRQPRIRDLRCTLRFLRCSGLLRRPRGSSSFHKSVHAWSLKNPKLRAELEKYAFSRHSLESLALKCRCHASARTWMSKREYGTRGRLEQYG